ncbi:MAG TPA: hypothetical protein DEB18_05495, partial [Leeuwenhoekiella sp.]|nr:hypothetical protein [Leeuwenhoekiella sp.]
MHTLKASKSSRINFLIKLKTGLCAFMFMLISSALKAQNDIATKEALAEKVYLQTDRSNYTLGETIWFKAIVAQAKDNVPSTLSGVLHVELIDPFETVVGEKLLNLETGIANNYFDIQNFYSPGTYQLRAYTQWNTNFKSDFIFKSYLTITEDKTLNDVVQKIEADDQDTSRFLFKPELIDSTISNKFDLELAYDDQVKKQVIRKNGAGYFLLEQDFPEGTAWVHMKLITESGKEWSQSIPLSQPAIDIQFLPEGGSLIAGINNLIGFKAINEKGKGVAVTGTVYDEANNVITSFKSNKLGMGRLYIFPKPEANYRVELKEPHEDLKLSYSFTDVVEKGSTLSVNEVGNNLAVLINSTQFVNDSVYVEVSSRGLILGEIARKLKAGKQTLMFSKESLPAGIIVFSLKDKNKNPLAERLFFNNLETEALPIDFKM